MSLVPDHIAEVVPALIGVSEGFRRIETHEQCEAAQTHRDALNRLRLDIDKKRKEAKQPHLDAGRAIDREARELIDPLKKAIDALDNARREYHRAVEAERLRAAAEQAEALVKASEEAHDPDADVPPDLSRLELDIPDAAPNRTRKRTVVDIVDPSKVPDEYRIIDEVRVRRDALAGKAIPGVVVRVEHDVA